MIAKRTALFLASTLLCLVTMEVWLRLRSPLELGFSYEGGRFVRAPEFVADGVANRLGFHDVEHGRKSPDAFRIVLLGDSYVAAESVTVEQIVGQRLQHHLDQRLGGGFEVVSFGRPGWGQIEQLAVLRGLAAQLEPDLVVTLFLSLNDVKNNYTPLQARGFSQRQRMPEIRPGWLDIGKADSPLFWIEGSMLNRFVSYRLAGILARRRIREVPVDYLVYAEEYGSDWKTAWRRTEALLLETRDLSHTLGAGYVLVSASTPQGVLGPDAWRTILSESFPPWRMAPGTPTSPTGCWHASRTRPAFPSWRWSPRSGSSHGSRGRNCTGRSTVTGTWRGTTRPDGRSQNT